MHHEFFSTEKSRSALASCTRRLSVDFELPANRLLQQSRGDRIIRLVPVSLVSIDSSSSTYAVGLHTEISHDYNLWLSA